MAEQDETGFDWVPDWLANPLPPTPAIVKAAETLRRLRQPETAEQVYERLHDAERAELAEQAKQAGVAKSVNAGGLNPPTVGSNPTAGTSLDTAPLPGNTSEGSNTEAVLRQKESHDV